jgi:hypothetical protein
MFRLKYKTPSPSEIEIPNKSYYVRDIKLPFILVCTVEISTLHFSYDKLQLLNFFQAEIGSS